MEFEVLTKEKAADIAKMGVETLKQYMFNPKEWTKNPLPYYKARAGIFKIGKETHKLPDEMRRVKCVILRHELDEWLEKLLSK